MLLHLIYLPSQTRALSGVHRPACRGRGGAAAEAADGRGHPRPQVRHALQSIAGEWPGEACGKKRGRGGMAPTGGAP